MPEDADNVSATSIAAALDLGHVQVRKDLAKVAHEGRRRTGRSREQLIRDIENYLDYASATSTILVGAGKLGQALLDYSGFLESGLNVMAVFDPQPAILQSELGKPIYSMSRLSTFCKRYDVRIGIIAVPPENAQDVCDGLVACGIHAIWNFSPVHLKVPGNVVVKNENLLVSINTLRMQLKNMGEHSRIISAELGQ
ncbi:MAG: redox-sensing transcriptional repressor Rex [Firmicutes bacterium]|nr:redox-sensing transcriptional repressor Rex [Bacillota bacterium]